MHLLEYNHRKEITTMFNTLIDQLVIGSECKIIESTPRYIKYKVGDMIITVYRQIGGHITCAVIRPIHEV